MVRASLPLGDLTTANAFDILPLGKGPDGRIGYPLVSVYLTGRELKDAAEIDASVGEMLGYARLYTAGITYTCNPERMILDRVTEVKILNEDGSEAWPAPDRLYRVVTDLYSAQMFASVQEQAYGLLKIVPKDQDGNEITDFTQAIVRDKDGNEIKAWQCVATYLSSFPAGADGVSVVPEAYAEPAGRKVIAPDASLGALFSNPGTTTSIGIALFVGILVAGFALALLIVRRMHRRQSIEPEHL